MAENTDLWTELAANHFGVAYEAVTPKQRKFARDFIAFAVPCGKGAEGFVEYVGFYSRSGPVKVSPEQAARIKADFEQRFPKLADYFKSAREGVDAAG